MLARLGGGYDASRPDAPRLALALASAFQDDPVIAWVFPDEQHRRAVLPAFMEFRLRKLALPHDQIWMTTDGAAAAIWFPPPGSGQESRWQRLRLLPPLVRSLGLRTPSVLGGLNLMEERHPHGPPHWYLFILGVEQAASRSRPRSSFRVVRGSGPCGAILTPTDRSGA